MRIRWCGLHQLPKGGRVVQRLRGPSESLAARSARRRTARLQTRAAASPCNKTTRSTTGVVQYGSNFSQISNPIPLLYYAVPPKLDRLTVSTTALPQLCLINHPTTQHLSISSSIPSYDSIVTFDFFAHSSLPFRRTPLAKIHSSGVVCWSSLKKTSESQAWL
jgi:hypothetical protein